MAVWVESKVSSFNCLFNMIWFSVFNIKSTFFVKHILHTILIFLIGLFSKFDQYVNFPTVLFVPFMNSIKWLIYFFGDFSLTLNNFEFWYHFLDSLNCLLVIWKLFLIEFFINICRHLVIHSFLHKINNYA